MDAYVATDCVAIAGENRNRHRRAANVAAVKPSPMRLATIDSTKKKGDTDFVVACLQQKARKDATYTRRKIDASEAGDRAENPPVSSKKPIADPYRRMAQAAGYNNR